MTDIDRQKEYKEALQLAQGQWGEWLEEADLDMRFYLGEQWNSSDTAYLKQQRRNVLVFNKVQRVVHMITGYQRKNRLALMAEPIESADQETAEQLSAVLMWLMTNMSGYNVMSDAFGGALKTGMNLVSIYKDFSNDEENGDIKLRRVPHNSYLLDPYFSERDMSDCSFLIYRKYVKKDEAKRLLPGKDRDIDIIKTGGVDGYFSGLASTRTENTMAYDEYWYRSTRRETRLFDMMTGESKAWNGNELALKALLAQYPSLKTVTKSTSSIALNIFLNGNLMYEGKDPNGLDDYPFVPVIGYFDPEAQEPRHRVRGIVRPIRDPQSEFNRRRSKMLDIIDSQISSGWQAKEGSVINKDSLYKSGQGQVVWMDQASQITDAQRLTAPDIPAGMFQLNELFDRDMLEISGANSELFGIPDTENTEIAASLAKIRQSTGLTNLQDLFDNYRLSKQLLGRKLIRLIQSYDPEKIARIINKQPTKEFYTRDFGKYDCIPSEAVLTDSQRQLAYAQLMSFRDKGAPIAWETIMEMSPLQNMQTVRDMLKTNEQQAQAAAQQQAAIEKRLAEQEIKMNELTQAMTVKTLAEKEQKLALGRHEDAMARLKNIEAKQKLQEMDEKRFMEGIDFIKRARGTAAPITRR